MYNYNIILQIKPSFMIFKTSFEGSKFVVVLYKSNGFKILLFIFYLYMLPELFFPPQENKTPTPSQFDVWCLKKWPGRKKKSKKKSKYFLLGGSYIWFIFDLYSDLVISITFIFIKMPAEKQPYIDTLRVFLKEAEMRIRHCGAVMFFAFCDSWLSRKTPYSGGVIKSLQLDMWVKFMPDS